MPRIYVTRPPMERILENSQAVSGPLSTQCLEYQGCIGNSGYGKTVVGSRTDGSRRSVYVHRFVWEHHNGPLTKGLEACHHCDNRRCCNHEHIYAGTRAQNAGDSVARGFHYSPFRKAERARHGLALGGTARRVQP